MLRRLTLGSIIGLTLVLGAGPALACGGLVAPNGAINLVRTTTLAGYHRGVEHYVTSFEFAGGGAEFGSIIPLPGVPSSVRRGGDWTLQRLQREVQPQAEAFRSTALAAASANDAVVILETKIDALDITVLKGGGFAVGRWAEDHGFSLSPDAPEVLDFYARRSPIFLAARFDAKRAEDLNQSIGDGTPIHVAIPTTNPWVPLRILGLGKVGSELVEADVFLLTDDRPAILPGPAPVGSERGLILERSEPASESLIADLRSDKGMNWIQPSGMWLSFLRVSSARSASNRAARKIGLRRA
jgi:hypothetical protein